MFGRNGLEEIAMSNTQGNNEHVDMKLEVVVLPVSDVDRAKRFYEGLGWRVDADFPGPNDFRVVQMTPPGSPCSVHFGNRVTTAAPGSVQNTYLVVSDMEAARAELSGHGVDVSEPFHFTGFGGSPVTGPDPEGRSYSTFATFKDPDGNGWLLQEIKTRFPGRGFSSDVATLTELLQETEKRHGGYEPTAPKHHWSGWYAAYIVARERGKTSDEAVKEATHHIEGALAAQS
jgi:catechol 2,3-dioxygenase-like lactoylglutathione lyase family enzyme